MHIDPSVSRYFFSPGPSMKAIIRIAPKHLTDLLLQSLKAYQIFFVSFMDLAGGFVGCGRFCADQSIGTTAALGDVRQVAFVALNDLMQMPATLLTYGKTMNGLVGVG